MKNFSFLIGQTYTDGNGMTRYKVTAVDPEFPSAVHFENLQDGSTGCILGDFVEHAINAEKAAV